MSRENNTADECNNNDFDRRSAGERFGFSGYYTDAYHEFMKVNNIFSGKMRRNSCSQSQSHSKVRMHPSIYHEEENMTPFDNIKSPQTPIEQINLIEN